MKSSSTALQVSCLQLFTVVFREHTAADRWVHLPSGRVYSLSYNRPRVDGRDDLTGEHLSKRPDDNPVRIVYSVRLDCFAHVKFHRRYLLVG